VSHQYNIVVAHESEVKTYMSQIGRPRADKPKNVNYSIRLDHETETALLNYCKENNISKGEAIRRAIRKLLRLK